MDNKEIQHLFERLEGTFDVFDTPEGHQRRFLDKLNAEKQEVPSKSSWWKPMSIAASFIILFGLGFTFLNNSTSEADLASVSPEMEQTQNFFLATINKELDRLESLNAPETKAIIEDALIQMEILEKRYEILKLDLIESGNDKRVIYAMINNFQSRISILEQVISTIEEVKNLNNTNNETTI